MNLGGERDVLGLWLGPTGGEGAKQWMTMVTELKNREIADALIVCCDGLKGPPDAIRVTWPDATVQTCVVHLVRYSLRYASKKHWSAVTRQMRTIYEAPTRRAVRHHGHFPNEQGALKVLYLVATQRRKNCENMTGRVHGWKQILNALTVHCGDRITDNH